MRIVDERTDAALPLVHNRRVVVRRWQAEALAPNREPVEVVVLPTHHDLEDQVEVGECHVLAHYDAAPDGRLDVLERDLELERTGCHRRRPYQAAPTLGSKEPRRRPPGVSGVGGYARRASGRCRADDLSAACASRETRRPRGPSVVRRRVCS